MLRQCKICGMLSHYNQEDHKRYPSWSAIYHLARIMGERKMRIADVVREMGLSRITVTLLYKETAQKVDLDTLDKLCELFDCGVGELLERATPTANKYQLHNANQ